MEESKWKILLTGGLGYIGSHTAVVFWKAWYDLVLLDNLSNSDESVLDKIKILAGNEVNIEFVNIDIKNKNSLERFFERNDDIDGVIHFAGKKAVWESCFDPFMYYENNIVGTINLLETMDKFWVNNLIFSSSATVYDSWKLLPPFVEGDRTGTYNPYGTTKLVVEYIIRDLAMYKWLNAINLRYFNPIWAHESGLIWENPVWIPNNLVPYVLKVATGEIERVKVFGNDYKTEDGTWIRDFIHVMDLAEAHLLAFEYIKWEWNINKAKENSDWKNWIEWNNVYDVFNIGTGEWQSVLDIIELVENVTGKEITYEIVDRRNGDIPISIANVQKAKNLLNRESKRSTFQAIEDSWKFVNNN